MTKLEPLRARTQAQDISRCPQERTIALHKALQDQKTRKKGGSHGYYEVIYLQSHVQCHFLYTLQVTIPHTQISKNQEKVT